MYEIVSKYVKGCVMCATGKPSNKIGFIYVSSCTFLSMGKCVYGFFRGFPMSKTSHDYLYVVVDRFRKMCILVPCKKQVTRVGTTHLFF
jgi:hypothetical protein